MDKASEYKVALTRMDDDEKAVRFDTHFKMARRPLTMISLCLLLFLLFTLSRSLIKPTWWDSSVLRVCWVRSGDHDRPTDDRPLCRCAPGQNSFQREGGRATYHLISSHLSGVKSSRAVGWGIWDIDLTDDWPDNWPNWLVHQSIDHSKKPSLETHKWQCKLCGKV